MNRKIVIIVSFFLILLCPLLASAGKPFRKPANQLVPESNIIVIGQVETLHPSLLKNRDGHPQAVAKIRVLEVLKAPDWPILEKYFYVRTNYRDYIMFDAFGKIFRLSSAWRYWIEPGAHRYLLLMKGDKKKGPYQVYISGDGGSGMVKLSDSMKDSDNEYLVEVRRILSVKESMKD